MVAEQRQHCHQRQEPQRQHERVTVAVHGRASAILLAPEDLERLEETIAVLSDAALLKQVSDAEADVEAGRI